MGRSHVSRRLWQVLEPVHAVVYLAPEVNERYRALGLEGFWTGYFAARSFPLGPVPAEVVAAMFFGFHPDMVRRVLPSVWDVVTADDVARARLEGVDVALRRLLGERLDAPEVAEAAALASEAASACPLAGRPLFAAQAALPWPDAAHLRLWHAATLLREHRGDGHVAANLVHGLDGLAAHVAAVAAGRMPRAFGQRIRGWSGDEWEACEARLAASGWLADGVLTEAGRAVQEAVERSTDELAAVPWEHLGDERSERLWALLLPIAETFMASGALPVPNGIGLPWPPAEHA